MNNCKNTAKPDQSAVFDSSVPTSFNLEWSITEENIIVDPYNYIKKLGGKSFRRYLCEAFNHWLNIPCDKLDIIIDVIQTLHNSSLIMDDIEDNSNLRRGQSAAHKIFGIPNCINCSNYVYFLCLQKVVSLGHPRCASVFSDQMLELHRGQGFDIYWRDAQLCPTVAQYKMMVYRKTGGLFAMAVRLMALFCPESSFCVRESELVELIFKLALFFQIRDDYANLVDQDYHDSKSFAEDITEGKYSYPIMLAVLHHPEDHLVSSVLRQRTDDVMIKRQCIAHMHELGVFARTEADLTQLELECRCLVKEKFAGNELLEQLLSKYCEIYQKKKL